MNFTWIKALRCLHPSKDRALMQAVKGRQLSLASEWIEAGADLDATHTDVHPVRVHITTSPLVCAIEQQNAPMVRLLLSQGASPESVPGRHTSNSPMTQWLVSLTHTSYITPAQEDIGFALLEAGADIKRGMVPEGSPILHDVLVQTGKMAGVDKIELRHLSAEMARSLDSNSPAPKGLFRRSQL